MNNQVNTLNINPQFLQKIQFILNGMEFFFTQKDNNGHDVLYCFEVEENAIRQVLGTDFDYFLQKKLQGLKYEYFYKFDMKFFV